MRIYIAGPMTGRPRYNYPAFREAAVILRHDDHDAVSPVELDEAAGHDPERDGVLSHADYMARCIPAVLSSEAVALLDGWASSKGAVCEVVVAMTCGHAIYTLDLITRELEQRDHAWVWARIAAKVAAGDHGRTRRRSDDGVTVIEDLPRGLLRNGESFTVPGVAAAIAEDEVRQLVALPEPEPAESVLAEAERLVNGPRQEDYGHPYDDFTRTGRIWGAILGIGDVPPATVGLMMAGVKISREVNRPKRDNLTDLAGYAGTVELVRDRERALSYVTPTVSAVESAA